MILRRRREHPGRRRGCTAVLVTLLAAVSLGSTLQATAVAANPPADFAKTIAVSASHALALHADGSVWSWGDTMFGQLGRSSTVVGQFDPTPAPVVGLTRVTAVQASNASSMALRSDGTVWTWGSELGGVLGRPTALLWEQTPGQVQGLDQVTAISQIGTVALALRSDGTVWSWGTGNLGALGRTIVGTSTIVPAPIPGLTDAVAIAAGGVHALVLRADGTVWSFGDNTYGELGRATPYAWPNPVPGPIDGLTNVTAISAGGQHSLAIRSDGTVWTFGSNSSGQLGRYSTAASDPVPRPVDGMTAAVDAVAASGYSVVVRSDGSVWSFGSNDVGQLANNVPPSGTHAASLALGLSGVTQVAAATATLAVRTDGSVWSYGSNAAGVLGRDANLGTLAPNPVPTGIDGLGPVPTRGEPLGVFGPRSYFAPLSPARVLDTRFGIGGVSRRLSAGETVTLSLAGVAGVSPGASAVALNVTATNTTQAGWFTLYPCDGPRPNASNVNYAAGQTVPNAVSVGLSASGQVCLFSSAAADAVVDVGGQYVPSSGLGFSALTPARLLDSRIGVGTPPHQLQAGEVVTLQVSGRGGVPVGATAAMLNVTAVDPTAAGWVTVYPCDAALPTASSLNLVAGAMVANLVHARLDPLGRTCLFTTSPTHLLADVAGYYSTGGLALSSFTPSRVLDTRFGIGGVTARVGAGQTLTVPVAGRGRVPSDATGAVLNVTVSGPDGAGWLTVYPCDVPRPLASNLNFAAGQTVPNLVATRLDAGGLACVFSTANVDLIVDAAGSFS